ncbi:MAG: hypothetical protein JW984_08330 [Deltaproteobacteria bacterium]|uniref:Uncharacterized protein n=1 Tax=Candidatus Zymogenus saltonus TaxID=2844893 RepID=A0A9D8PPT7_9DELT|nr:hypothetical protein [Candidatus Zymogenus saltonus]
MSVEVTCPNCESSRDINGRFLAHGLKLTCPNCRSSFKLPQQYEIALENSTKYFYKLEIVQKPNMLDPFFKKKIETIINKSTAEGWILEKIMPWTMRNLFFKKDVLYLFFKKSRNDEEDE